MNKLSTLSTTSPYDPVDSILLALQHAYVLALKTEGLPAHGEVWVLSIPEIAYLRDCDHEGASTPRSWRRLKALSLLAPELRGEGTAALLHRCFGADDYVQLRDWLDSTRAGVERHAYMATLSSAPIPPVEDQPQEESEKESASSPRSERWKQQAAAIVVGTGFAAVLFLLAFLDPFGWSPAHRQLMAENAAIRSQADIDRQRAVAPLLTQNEEVNAKNRLLSKEKASLIRDKRNLTSVNNRLAAEGRENARWVDLGRFADAMGRHRTDARQRDQVRNLASSVVSGLEGLPNYEWVASTRPTLTWDTRNATDPRVRTDRKMTVYVFQGANMVGRPIRATLRDGNVSVPFDLEPGKVYSWQYLIDDEGTERTQWPHSSRFPFTVLNESERREMTALRDKAPTPIAKAAIEIRFGLYTPALRRLEAMPAGDPQIAAARRLLEEVRRTRNP